MSPRKFAMICGIAQGILKWGLPIEMVNNPSAVLTSAAVVGCAAYFAKRRLNHMISEELALEKNSTNPRKNLEAYRRATSNISANIKGYAPVLRTAGFFYLNVM